MFNSKYSSQSPLFSANPFEMTNHSKRLYTETEPLYVGLDTETTGFDSDPEAFPLSVGICVYRNGKHSPEEDHHIIMLPPARRAKNQPQKLLLDANGFPIRSPLSEGSEAVHGLSGELLGSSYQGRITRDKNGSVLRPALEHGPAIAKVFDILRHYQKQGAIFVGHNLKFDWNMLQKSHERENDNMSPATAGFNMAAARMYTADSLEHAKARGDGAPGFRRDKASGLMVPVNDSRRLEDLCPAWGVSVGGHAALGDARSSVELLLKQIAKNKEALGIADNIRTSSVGQSGIDYSLAGPHDGKRCSFCAHLDKVAGTNIDETGQVIDKDHHIAVETARSWHKNPQKAKGLHPMTPQLVLTAKKRDYNA